MQVAQQLNRFVLIATVTAIIACRCRAQDGADWRYVADAAFGQSPLQSIALTEQTPDNLTIDVAFRGRRRGFAQLRYGSPNSTRVAVVVDEIRRGEFDLYRLALQTPKEFVVATGQCGFG